MDIHARRRTINIGLAYLAEAVADVLQDAQDNDEGGLAATTISARSGLPQGGWSTCRFILDRLDFDGVAVNDQPGSGNGSWRLVEQ